MKRKRFSVEQIVAVLKQAERMYPAGRHFGTDVLPLEEAIRRAAVGPGARIQAAADENARLKKLVAELSLDKAILQDVAAKNWRGPHACSRVHRAPLCPQRAAGLPTDQADLTVPNISIG
jgi:putative transposase